MAGLAIRPLRSAEASRLPEIERDAASRFRSVGLDTIAEGDVTDVAFIEAIIANGIALGAFDGALLQGFALAGHLDDALHIYELSVATAAGGRGIGSALIAALAEEAGRRALSSLTLSTFVDVPWNGPFYARRGFMVVPETRWPPAAHLIRNAERSAGLPLERRVFMRKPLTQQENGR